MTLLHALAAVADNSPRRIVVAHFNHQLRGRSSDADETLVRKTTEKLGLRFVVGRSDVRRFARKSKLSIEMAARKLRHEFLARVARDQKLGDIALAHHADDQVELFFLRVLRGAGGEGLAGMKWRSPSPVNPAITLIRPLLGFTKRELREFATEQKIEFREDATNAQLGAPRNRIRNELLPLLRKHYQPGLTQTVLRIMEIVGAESEVIGQLAGNWLQRHRPDFEKLPVAVQRRVLQSQLEKLKLSSDFELMESLRRVAGEAINVGPTTFITRDPAGAVRLHRQSPSADFKQEQLSVNLAGGAGEACFGAVVIKWRFGAGSGRVPPRTKTACELFDAAKVGSTILLRHWRPGDRFEPIGLKTPAKLQDLFINAKIPRDRRRELVVATTVGGEIFWVEGLRISENFKLTPVTRRHLAWGWHR